LRLELALRERRLGQPATSASAAAVPKPAVVQRADRAEILLLVFTARRSFVGAIKNDLIHKPRQTTQIRDKPPALLWRAAFSPSRPGTA
jgi:hypothetical protein